MQLNDHCRTVNALVMHSGCDWPSHLDVFDNCTQKGVRRSLLVYPPQRHAYHGFRTLFPGKFQLQTDDEEK